MKDMSALDELLVGRVEPRIYAFTTNTVPNHLKVGDTYRPVSVRLSEWRKYYPGLEKQFEHTAKVDDDVYFRDHSVHRFLEHNLAKRRLRPDDLDDGTYYSNEFFAQAVSGEVAAAIEDIAKDYGEKSNRYQFYNAATALPAATMYASTGHWALRPNQQATIDAFKAAVDSGRTNLLMYAVMRFGKSFTAMCCAAEMNARLVIVVSAKADVRDEWKKTVEAAENFRNDYEFLSSDDINRNHSIVTNILDKDEGSKNVVVFLTLQDLQGDTIKDKHQQVFGRTVDLLIIDETHFGARAEKYGQVLREAQFKGEKAHQKDDDDYIELAEAQEDIKAFDARVKLHLSGTPYRILMGSEFQKEDVIAFYQFTDITQDQEAWDRENLLLDDTREWDNPYYGFPQMIRFAFNPNEASARRLSELRESGVAYAFSALFKPQSIKRSDDGSHKRFVYESEILELLRAVDGSEESENLLGFLDYAKIKEGMMCRHVVCVLPYCAACDAMEALIKDNAERFKNLYEYEIINISGVESANAYRTPNEIKSAIKGCEAEGKKTITLTVNRMLTGSTVEEWDTMLFLKDTASPQEYDQAVFRLQNQYVKTYVDERGDTIKYNMKPQTLLVDFDPNRMFRMQEQKSQIYNVNTDEAGNTRLEARLAAELRISPIFTMNEDRMARIEAADILKAVSDYSRERGVAEETNDIPVDLSLVGVADVWSVIGNENELGSRAGFEVSATEGEGDELELSEPEDENETDMAEREEDDNDSSSSDMAEENQRDPAKQIRMYYARILYFAFLTKASVNSLESILACLDQRDNERLFRNLGLHRQVLRALKDNMNPFALQRLDYKVQNLNKLANDNSVPALERAEVANRKFGKLGESQVITPARVCDDMVSRLPEKFLGECLTDGKAILDIASKEGEFAIALYKRYEAMGYDRDVIRGLICSIPTSSVTYEFTRRIYEILGLHIDCIAEQFNAYDLLKMKTGNGAIDFARIKAILSQDKPFSSIRIQDEVDLGGEGEVLKFGAVVGNPPYQEGDGGAQKSARPIYHHFVTISKKLTPEYMSFIIPSRWYAGGKGLDEFRNEMLNDPHIQQLDDFLHPEEVFPDTNNRGGICYFLWNAHHDNAESKVKVVTHEGGGRTSTACRGMKTRDIDIFIRSSQAIAILDKVLPDNTVRTMVSHISPRKPFGLEGAFISTASFHATADGLENPVRCYGKAKAIGYVERSLITTHSEWIDNWKVFLPYANNIGTELKDDNQNTFVVGPGSICTETFLAAGADLSLDEQSAQNLSNYLRTRFARFLLGLAKISQHGTSKTYRFVPVQDFTSASDIDWAKSMPEIDAQLYCKYGLASEEIDCIESKIRQMD